MEMQDRLTNDDKRLPIYYTFAFVFRKEKIKIWKLFWFLGTNANNFFKEDFVFQHLSTVQPLFPHSFSFVSHNQPHPTILLHKQEKFSEIYFHFIWIVIQMLWNGVKDGCYGCCGAWPLSSVILDWKCCFVLDRDQECIHRDQPRIE